MNGNNSQNFRGTKNNANYLIDWCAVLPDNKYACSFVYIPSYSNILLTAQDTVDHLTSVLLSLSLLLLLLLFNLGCTTNYTCNGSTLSTTNIIGMLK